MNNRNEHFGWHRIAMVWILNHIKYNASKSKHENCINNKYISLYLGCENKSATTEIIFEGMMAICVFIYISLIKNLLKQYFKYRDLIKSLFFIHCLQFNHAQLMKEKKIWTLQKHYNEIFMENFGSIYQNDVFSTYQ